MFSANNFVTVLLTGFFVYSLPYEQVLKLTFAEALNYSNLVPNVRSE